MTSAVDPFQAFYDENHPKVVRLLVRIAGADEAEDLAQVVFAKAAQALPNFRGEAQVRTWLYRITVHVASDWLRSRPAKEAKRTVELPENYASEGNNLFVGSARQGNDATPEQELIRKQMCDCIRRVVGQLPKKHRTILMLAELGGLSDDEVAQTLEISRGNARVRLHRARAALRQKLEMRCDFSRNEDNEFVCEPKPTARCASPDRSRCSGTGRPDVDPGNAGL